MRLVYVLIAERPVIAWHQQYLGPLDYQPNASTTLPMNEPRGSLQGQQSGSLRNKASSRFGWKAMLSSKLAPSLNIEPHYYYGHETRDC